MDNEVDAFAGNTSFFMSPPMLEESTNSVIFQAECSRNAYGPFRVSSGIDLPVHLYVFCARDQWLGINPIGAFVLCN